MTTDNVMRKALTDCHGELLFVDDCDECVIGVGRQHGITESVAIYDNNKLIEHFAEVFKDQEDPWASAVEWVDFNITCAYLGKLTPIFMNPFNQEEL